MNRPSLDKFASKVKPGGLIVVNSSLVDTRADRQDCTVIYVAANDLAIQAGTARAANLVMLGTYVGWSGVVEAETTIKMIEKEFARKAKFIPANVAAFKMGLAEGVKAKGGKA